LAVPDVERGLAGAGEAALVGGLGFLRQPTVVVPGVVCGGGVALGIGLAFLDQAVVVVVAVGGDGWAGCAGFGLAEAVADAVVSVANAAQAGVAAVGGLFLSEPARAVVLVACGLGWVLGLAVRCDRALVVVVALF